ncbi:helix-turn-helix domain-containing protein [Sphingobacterium sp. DK4209]|uniref:Helix-turn-helix domain-containing protein n=1 Tax=Sphingobacterium zhuxiongii TaxID=2662364 RepID=A0A5Q0QFW0_9SPHI|nr:MULTISPECIES: helix-turn-helix domain-containing protein [unclassified Sphingobacterium]MVZ67448.1 helix-turn-helix domain-containing protein [Sphingobacterium sp. DK4209]QGA26462.1 helix-turn-helix domain-containing protein [Sphingobacterium sp. dk4302]
MEKLRRDQLVTLEDLEGLKLELLDSMEKLIRAKFRDHKVKRWMKSAEVRKLLGFSPGKLQSIRQSGILPYTQIGGNIYYDPEDLAKLFNDKKRFKDDFQP